MEFLTAFLQLIAGFFEGIFYYFFLFFFLSEPAYTHIFKIVLLLIIGFLIYTSFRPAKWKWRTLFVAETVLILAGLVVSSLGYEENSIGDLGYGIVSSIWGFIMLVLSFICWGRVPFGRKKAQSNSAPAPAENPGTA